MCAFLSRLYELLLTECRAWVYQHAESQKETGLGDQMAADICVWVDRTDSAPSAEELLQDIKRRNGAIWKFGRRGASRNAEAEQKGTVPLDADVLAAAEVDTRDTWATQGMDDHALSEAIRREIANMPNGRDKDIMEQRLKRKSYRQIGEQLGMSHEYIRRVARKVVERLDSARESKRHV